MKKPESISIMRARALKYCEVGEFDKALHLLENQKKKISTYYSNPENTEMLHICQNEIEILKKKNVQDSEEVNSQIV